MNKILRNGIIAAIVLGTVGTSSFYNYTYAKGDGAVEEGEGASADGEGSVAIGKEAKAQDSHAVSIGYNAKVQEGSTVAIGHNAKAQKNSAVAIGHSAEAQGGDSVAIGRDANAALFENIAIGVMTKANGIYSMALGLTAEANGLYSVALGASAHAVEEHSLAFGENAVAFSKSSVAIGFGSKANDEYEFSVGKDESVGYGDNYPKEAIYRRITHVADGVKGSDAVTLSQARAFISGEIDSSNTTSSVTGAKIKAALDKKANVDLDNLTTAGINKVKTLAGEQITETVTQDFVTEKVKKGNVSSTTLDVKGDGKMVGSDLKIDLKDGIVTKKKLSSDLQTEIENKADALALSAYAKTDATNITGDSLTKWQSALGNGTIAENDKGLVTGGTVYTALKGKANVDLDNLTTAGTNKVKTLAGEQIAETVTQDFVTEKVKKGNVSSTTLDVTGDGKMVGSDLKIDLKDGIVTKKKLSSDLQTEIKNKANTSDLIAYAKTDATNITGDSLTKWQSVLGNGTIAENNKGLVTGGTVHTALKGKANVDLDNLTTAGTSKVKTLAGEQITATVTQDFVTEKVKKGNVSSTTLDVTGTGKLVDSDLKIDLKDGIVTKKKLSSDLQTEIENKANTSALSAYAKIDATNITGESLTKWQSALGNGTIAENNKGLVTGGTVYTALKGKADKNAENIEVLAWKKKLGLVDAQATQDSTNNIFTQITNINNDITNLKGGFIVSAGTNSKEITLGGTTKDTLTFASADKNLTATFNETNKTISYGVNVANLIGDINKSDTKITNVDLTNNQTITNLKTEIQNITGGSGTTGSLSTKADTTANNLTKDEDILAWQKKLGLADNSVTVQPGSTATTTNLFTTVNQLKAGYTVKAGTNTFDMKLGDTAAPTIEFAGDSTNGLDVAADKAGKKITYTFNKEKLVKYIAGDLIKQMNGEGTPGSGDPSGHGTGEQGQTTPLPVLTNVSTGFNIAVGNNSKNFTFGKGKETNKLTFAGTNDETVISLTGENGKPTVTVGLADAFKTKVNNKADKSDLTKLETKVTNITNGTTNIDGSKINLTTNNTFTTLQNTVNGKADKSDLDAYAKKDAANITGESLTKWQSALGNGTIAENNKGLVTGGTVYTALKGKADKNAENIEVLAWKKKLGLIDAQATQDSTTNISTQITNINSDITNLKGGFIVSDGKKSKEITLGGTTKDKLTFASADKNLTATFDDAKKTISYGVNVANLIGDINKSDTKITNVDWNKFEGINFYSGGTSNGTTYTPSAKAEDKWQSSRIVFGKGLKAEELKDANNNKYTKISVIGGGQGGKSAYEIWRDHKESDNSQPNKGKSEEDFMNYMKGKDCSADIQHIVDNVTKGLSSMDGRINRVSAGAAALSALRPISNAYDPDNKLDFSVGFGYYKGENAVAIGAYYRPDSNTIISLGGAFNGDDNLLNAGLSFKLGKTTPKENRQTQLQQEVDALKEKNGVMEKTIQEQNEKIKELEVLVRSVIHK